MRTAFFLLAAAFIVSPVFGQTNYTSVTAAASANANLTTLTQALQTAGLAPNTSVPGTLSDPTLVATVFAPSNAAFTNYLTANNLTAQQLLAAPTLAYILKFHVVPGVAAKAANITNGEVVPTLLGPSLTLYLSGGSVIVGGGSNNATVTTADVAAGQAIVHIIDAVLMPPKSALAPAPAPAPYRGYGYSG